MIWIVNKKSEYRHYMIFILFIILAYVSYLIIEPFITPIVLSFVIAYIFYPLYKTLHKKIDHKKAAALITSILVVLIIMVPSFFIAQQMSKEVFVSYLLTKQKIVTGYYSSGACANGEGIICQTGSEISRIISDPKYGALISSGLEKVQQYAVESASALLTSIPKLVLALFITFFIVYYLFKDGTSLVRKTIKVLPLKKTDAKSITKRFHDVIHGIIYGTLLTAIIQGIVATLGYFVFGVPSPLLWGVITAFFALIPFLGTPIIWAPAGILMVINGYIQNDSSVIGKGIGLLVYGTFVISLIDNFLKPKLIGSRADVHPAIVLLGVLGGLALFGAMGIVIGPLMLALFITFIKLYENEKK